MNQEITAHDLYAGLAMLAIIGQESDRAWDLSKASQREAIAWNAYRMADEMMKQRETQDQHREGA